MTPGCSAIDWIWNEGDDWSWTIVSRWGWTFRGNVFANILVKTFGIDTQVATNSVEEIKVLADSCAISGEVSSDLKSIDCSLESRIKLRPSGIEIVPVLSDPAENGLALVRIKPGFFQPIHDLNGLYFAAGPCSIQTGVSNVERKHS